MTFYKDWQDYPLFDFGLFFVVRFDSLFIMRLLSNLRPNIPTDNKREKDWNLTTNTSFKICKLKLNSKNNF